jgi:hypothetical protein
MGQANAMGYEVAEAMIQAVNNEIDRCVEASQTDENKRLKSVAKGMIQRALGEAKMTMRKHVEDWIMDEARILDDLKARSLKQIEDWSELNEQAKLVRFAKHEFATCSIPPHDSDRAGIAQYNRSLGLVMSAALGLKTIGGRSEAEDSKS